MMSRLFYPYSNTFYTFATYSLNEKQYNHERSKSPRNQPGIRIQNVDECSDADGDVL